MQNHFPKINYVNDEISRKKVKMQKTEIKKLKIIQIRKHSFKQEPTLNEQNFAVFF